ncbi:MAG: GxxExxY protein [Paludibacter sp.]|nr:GxxExxY protein [Paludibacter sp.]
MADILYKDESYKIIGSCMKVHAELGAGFLESVYQEALEKQFIKDNVPYKREQKLRIQFDSELLDKYFKSDFVCYDKIIMELKSTPMIYKKDEEQLVNYLKATNIKLGILVCFGSKSLTYKRIVH